MELLEVIKEQFNKIDIKFPNIEIDAIYIKNDIQISDIAPESKSDNNNISHFALTSEAKKIFPFIYLPELIDERNNLFARFFILKLPFYFSSDNFNYAYNKRKNLDNELLNLNNYFEDNTILISKLSIQYSLKSNEKNDQLKFATKLNSDKLAYDYRCLIEKDDCLIILKEKNCLKYHLYIIKVEDNIVKDFDKRKQIVYSYSSKSHLDGTEVNFEHDLLIDYQKEFSVWLSNIDILSLKTISSYLSSLNYFSENEHGINLWKDPIDILTNYDLNVIKDMATKINNTSFNRNDSGGTSFSAAIRRYFDWLNEMYNKNILHGQNIIYYGAPGTGKSFKVQNYIKKHGLLNYNNKTEHPNVIRTTLHPESSYHDFVGQIMPVVTKDNDGKDLIKYDFKPQVFTLALERALEKSDEPVFLILEEMSRANVAAVFGDIFQLLDRDEDGRSEYLIDNELIQKYLNEQFSKKNIGLSLSKIYIPHNLFIIGTVNTSDQNVFVMDTAFKRRFEFEYLDANYTALDEAGKPLNNFVFNIGKMNFSWINFIHNLNEFIVDDLNGLGLTEDKQLGQFFIKFKLDDNELTERSIVTNIENQDNYSVNYDKLKGKLLQYLWNDVRGASYSEKSLFDSNIKSFGELYKKFEEKEQVFSKEFLEKFVKEESYNEIQN